MLFLMVVTAFLASMSAAAPTPAQGGGSIADLIAGNLAETDCTGIDEGTIAASGFICEEGTRGAEVDAGAGDQSDAGNAADAEEAGDVSDAQGAGNNNSSNDQDGAAIAQDATGNNNDNARQDDQGAQDNAEIAADAQQDESGAATGAQDEAVAGDETGADATGDNGGGVNLFDLVLQGFQPVDCTSIDEATVAASGFNCIDGTRGA